MTYGLQGQWLHTFKNNSILTTRANWAVSNVTQDNAHFSFSNSNAINQMLLDNYKFQTSDNWTTTLNLRYSFPIPEIINAFVGLDYSYQHYSLGNNNSLLGSIGILF